MPIIPFEIRDNIGYWLPEEAELILTAARELGRTDITMGGIRPEDPEKKILLRFNGQDMSKIYARVKELREPK